ncbi:MAG: hypothetical protein HC852_09090 [Acaryochloridaceae cyanobacterium RU_4_10]|nr:hypothetical protein [Acaryochloridaceae cyanobacterium RU_4_10]
MFHLAQTEIDDILFSNQVELIVTSTINHPFPSDDDLKIQGVSENERLKILAYIESAKSDALAIQQKLESINTHLQPQGIPIEIDGEMIALSPNSAEAKAIQRLNDLEDPDKWITVMERDEEVDLEELDKKIRESGYLV